ncbi:MAG: hypothetical protein AAGA03_18915, partial [Planctomycetota bacterium]
PPTSQVGPIRPASGQGIPPARALVPSPSQPVEPAKTPRVAILAEELLRLARELDEESATSNTIGDLATRMRQEAGRLLLRLEPRARY